VIWQLAREQLRSQKRFIAWTAALLTAAIALASYAAISTTTQISNDLHAQRIDGYDKLYLGYANSNVTGAAGADEEYGTNFATTQVVDAQVQAAIETGSDIQVTRYTPLYAMDPFIQTMYSLNIVVIGGDYPWDDVLVEGSAPESGEIVISRRIADYLGVGIGDSIDPYSEEFGPDAVRPVTNPDVSLVVSGITVTPGSGRNYDVGIPEAMASWEDRRELYAAVYAQVDNSFGDSTAFTKASWNTATTDLSAFEVEQGPHYGSGAGRSDGAGVSIAISIALFVGLIAMSFAVGRSPSGRPGSPPSPPSSPSRLSRMPRCRAACRCEDLSSPGRSAWWVSGSPAP